MTGQIEMHERVITVEASASSAHKRIDTIEQNHWREILSLRDTRHEHSNMLQNHDGMLGGLANSIVKLEKSIDNLGASTDKNTVSVLEFKTMGRTALWIFSLIGSLVVMISGIIAFIGANLMGWW